MRRARFRIIDEWAGPFVRLTAANNREVMRSSEVYNDVRGAQKAIRVARRAVAAELAEALRRNGRDPGYRTAEMRRACNLVAAILPHLADYLPDTPVEDVAP